MHSTHNKEKPVVDERFIRTLKNKVYKYMISTAKNLCIDKLDDTVNECNNAYHITTKMRHVDVKSSTYIDFSIDKNNKDAKFEVVDHVRMSKFKNIFRKYYVLNWPEEGKMLKILTVDIYNRRLYREDICGTFYEQELQNANQTEFEMKK